MNSRWACNSLSQSHFTNTFIQVIWALKIIKKTEKCSTASNRKTHQSRIHFPHTSQQRWLSKPSLWRGQHSAYRPLRLKLRCKLKTQGTIRMVLPSTWKLPWKSSTGNIYTWWITQFKISYIFLNLKCNQVFILHASYILDYDDLFFLINVSISLSLSLSADVSVWNKWYHYAVFLWMFRKEQSSNITSLREDFTYFCFFITANARNRAKHGRIQCSVNKETPKELLV